MFYENQPVEQQNDYKQMLEIIGSLTLLFSESDSPYLPYRCHENIFCKYFEATNLGRMDCSADAKKNRVGIGLKTWMGNDDQKVAEFGRLRPEYENLRGIELIRRIAEYRNDRIRITMNLHGIDEMIYHIVKRVPGSMKILEHAFEYIDIDNIEIITNRGNSNNTYFTDGNHTYHFSLSKNTLYMIFSELDELDSFPVQIMADPYAYLMEHRHANETPIIIETMGTDVVDYTVNLGQNVLADIDLRTRQLCLRLYTIDRKTGEKIVAPTSGLNQWNGVRTSNRRRADGTVVHVETPRDPNELYIPYTAKDRNRKPDFFPPRDVSFNLHLPDGTIISAKVCQEAYKKMSEEKYDMLTEDEKRIEDERRMAGKAIMSNPNRVLGEWLLRKVFELQEGTPVTYHMLERFGIDSVIFTKIDDLEYSIDFSETGTYEMFYEEESEEDMEE